MSRWRYWWPERGERDDDYRVWDEHAWRDPEFVARDIAERDFYRDPWSEGVLVVVSPNGQQTEVAIEVQSEPVFRTKVRGPSTPATPWPGASPNKRNDDECTCADDATSFCPIHHGYAR